MHISKPWKEDVQSYKVPTVYTLHRSSIYIFVQSFKKIGIKLYEELRSRGTNCLYTAVEK